MSLPASIGRFRSVIRETQDIGHAIETFSDLVSCSGLFSQTNESIKEETQKKIKAGLCFDPEIAVVNGAEIYSNTKTLLLKFVGCLDDETVEDKTTCTLAKNLPQYLREKTI